MKKSIIILLIATILQLKANDNEALINYSSTGDIKKVTTLLKKGADPNYKLSEDGSTAIIVSKNVKITELLFQNNANINAQDDNGISALAWSAANGRKEIVEFLLNNNADPTLKDKYGNTADKYADNKNYYAISELIRKKIEIKNEAINKQNYTKFINEAYIKLNAKDYEGSIVLYTKAIQITSKSNTTPYTYRAFAKVNVGYYRSAIEDCNYILKHPDSESNHMSAYYTRALCELYLSDYFKVLNEYNSNPDFKRSDGALSGLSSIQRGMGGDPNSTRETSAERILKQKREYRELIWKTKEAFKSTGACEDFVKAIELGSEGAASAYNEYCK